MYLILKTNLVRSDPNMSDPMLLSGGDVTAFIQYTLTLLQREIASPNHRRSLQVQINPAHKLT